jgi:hypothetical protein
MVSPPVVAGTYPVFALIDPLGVHWIGSVDKTPVATVVTTVAQAAEAIAEVPSTEVPWEITVTDPAGPVGPAGPTAP